jgi:hypothetical protein
MKHGVDANRQFTHRKNRTALHDASRYGKVEACRALIAVSLTSFPATIKIMLLHSPHLEI